MGDERLVRRLSPGDTEDALRCVMTAFLTGRDVGQESVDWVRERWDFDRAWGAVDDGRLCGTARTFGSRLRVPGGNDVPVSCLTSVTVLPTHTRRGHLTRMMRAQLDAAVEAGEIASLLIAAEWPIYGRYGYGPASEWVEWEVDTQRAVVTGEAVGRCELVDAAEVEKVATEVLARHQSVTPGAIEAPPWFVAVMVGTDPRPWDKHEGRARVVHYGDDGAPDGFVMYDPKERWDGMRPGSRLDVAILAAVTPEAERELWRYLVAVDLVGVVKRPGSAVSVLPWALADGRAAHQAGRWDHLWARPIDVAACLSARAYGRSGRVVVEVVDEFLGRGGRVGLDAGDGGAEVRAARGESADVTLDAACLGAAWLGGRDLRVLAAGGGRWSVDEHRPGALTTLAELLLWPETPDCPVDF